MAMITTNQLKKILDTKKNFRVVFLGDSITSTEWVHPNWREMVEYVLKEEMVKIVDDWKSASWGIRTINCGYDGSTTRDILNEKMKEIESFEPDLVISIMGGNDTILGVKVEESKTNIEKITKELEKKRIRVFWCNSIAGLNKEKNKRYEEYAKTTLEIEGSEKRKYFDLFNEFKKFDLKKFFTFLSEENLDEGIKEGEIDTVHPNQLGNAYIAKIILKEVFGLGFDPEKYIRTTNLGYKYPEY